MPQLAKGGKWVFGWVVVQPDRRVTIPPEAWKEYGFEVGEETIFMRSSRTSGGFVLATPRLIAGTAISLDAEQRVLGRGHIKAIGHVTMPEKIEMKTGQRLLAVRGSGRGLSFLQYGRIVEEAQKHPEIEVFN